MDDNLPGLLDDVDTEFLHDFRVAVRRTRSTLKLGRPALPHSMRSRVGARLQVARRPDDPGARPRRLRARAAHDGGLAGGRRRRPTWRPFAAHLRRRRTAVRRALVRGLRSQRYRRLRTDWDLALGRLARARLATARSPPGSWPTAAISPGGYRRVVARRRGHRRPTRRPTDLHELRKRCKELRYALEVFAPVDRQGRTRKKVVGDLKDLQDVLGRFQDAEVQRQALRELRRGDDGRRHPRRGRAGDGRAGRPPGRRAGPGPGRVRRAPSPVRPAGRATAGCARSEAGR